MGSVSIKTILESLEMESFIEIFQRHRIDVDFLKEQCDSELTGILKEIDFPIGRRTHLKKKIEEIRGKCTKVKHVFFSFATNRSDR